MAAESVSRLSGQRIEHAPSRVPEPPGGDEPPSAVPSESESAHCAGGLSNGELGIGVSKSSDTQRILSEPRNGRSAEMGGSDPAWERLHGAWSVRCCRG